MVGAVRAGESRRLAMEIWAWCGQCRRWFYCERDGGERTTRVCPVCVAAPDAVEDRAALRVEDDRPRVGVA